MRHLVLFFCLTFGVAEAWAQQAPAAGSKTVWQGVFTADQADRGRDTFNANCTGCHNRPADLSGGEAHALKGSVWFDRWREDTLQSLFNKMKGYMPPAKPRLADGDYADIIAFLLRENAFPAGAQELRAADVNSIRVEGQDGPKPLPNLALVNVVGCLSSGANNSWNLTSATDPVRTREPEQSSPEEIQAAETTSLGMQTFQLRALDVISDFVPETHKGKRVQAKGVIYTTQTPNRVSVISIAPLAGACNP
jgi:mono/diheme cytochrome c family protein